MTGIDDPGRWMARRDLLAISVTGVAGTVGWPASARGPQAPPRDSSTIAPYPFQQVNVFSERPTRGNPLAVVGGADALSTEDMAAFARWTNLSETTFLTRPTEPRADYRVRIFTAERELDFAAGHPTLGSCHAWLAWGGVPKGADVVQQCGTELTRIRRTAGRFTYLAPGLIRSGAVDRNTLRRVAAGLHLPPSAILASRWVDNGPGWLAVMLGTREEVLSIRPDWRAIAGLHVGVVAPWRPETDGMDARFEVRAFSAGGFEDPVTGSLNAGLAVWLIGTGRAPPSYVASQGTALGRLGRVFIESRGPEIWIGGAVVPCISGQVEL